MSETQANVQKRVNIPAIKQLPPLSESIKKISTAKQQLPVQAVKPVQVEPPQQASAPSAPVAAAEVQEQATFDTIAEMEVSRAETYMRIGTQEHGYVDFDLMSHREKGQEVRYLNIQVQGFSVTDRGKVNHTYMAITSKEEFEAVKSFFSTLQWED